VSTRIAIWLFDGVEELDFAGPWEVLTFWAREVADVGEVEVRTFALQDGPVTCAKGLRVLPDDVGWPAAPDVLLVPGGEGTRPLLGREDVRAALRERHAAGTLVTSVCTGSLVLADAGLLDGRRATTYWAHLDLLERLGAVPDADERFVDLGDVVTAAGVSAGMDMALHLVARLADEVKAGRVRRGIQYDPAPPVPNA
jgi:transcriptional regulator GlxA family with amidase domain